MYFSQRSFRRRFWIRVVSMLLLSYNFLHFTIDEIGLDTPESENEKEMRIVFTTKIKKTNIEQATVYYKNIQGFSSIEILEVPCNVENINGKEVAESLKRELAPLKGEIDRIFRIFVLDFRPAKV